MTPADTVHHAQPSPPDGQAISVSMLEEHLAQVLSAWFGDHDLPPDDWGELDPYIENMRRGLAQDGDVDPFQSGLWALLAIPGLDLSRFNAGQSDYDDGEMREIFAHVLRRLSDAGSPTPVTQGAALLNWYESAEDWWVRRGILHRVRAGDTLRVIAAQHGIPLKTLLDRNPYHARRYGPDVALSSRERVVRIGASAY